MTPSAHKGHHGILHPRLMHQGFDGGDVYALQRALVASKVRKRESSRHFGPHCRADVMAYQRRHGLQVDGEAGKHTVASLATPNSTRPYTWGYYDGFGKWLIEEYIDNRPKHPPAADLRVRMVRAAMWGVSNRGLIHYAQIRPMPLGKYKSHYLPETTDCSGYYTCCAYVAGWSDPNGFGYNGLGYTGTMLNHGHRLTSTGQLQPGDAVFYYYPVAHVAVYLGNGRVASHGSEGGPWLASLGYAPISAMRSYV